MSKDRTETGEIVHIGETQSFGSGDFTKRVLVIKTEADTDYPQLVPFEFKKERGALLDAYAVGQTVTVHFNLGGRENNGRYFVDLTGWRLSACDDQPAPAATVPDQSAPDKPIGDDDSLPF